MFAVGVLYISFKEDFGKPAGLGRQAYVKLEIASRREVAYTPAAPYAPHKPVVQKNHKLLCSLILGILAMGILNFMPFVAFILSLIALCTGYSGLKQGEISKGKRVCGYVGLALGIIGLILSVTMLTMLLTLSLRATEKLSNSANGMIR